MVEDALLSFALAAAGSVGFLRYAGQGSLVSVRSDLPHRRGSLHSRAQLCRMRLR